MTADLATRTRRSDRYGAVAEGAPLDIGIGPPGSLLGVDGALKRTFDIVFAATAILVLLPVLLLLAAAVKLSCRGPVLFSHVRIGRGGRAFRCLKFRSMCVDGDAVLAAHLEASPEAQIEWNATRKLRRDPRVTAIGRFLRKSSLDELPQLLNILRGDMSVVGPRPVVSDELDLYGANARYYLAARPGLTGLWQISGRNDVSYSARVNFDRSYAENWSLLGDVAIIMKTVPAVLSSRGTY
jgi:exopolysaccharide production protein ExoY